MATYTGYALERYGLLAGVEPSTLLTSPADRRRGEKGL